MVVGDTVTRNTLKNNDQYDKRMAKVERLNVRAVVVTILEGPAPGEKRKVDYKALKVWPCSSPTKQQVAGGVVSAVAAALFCTHASKHRTSHNPVPIRHQSDTKRHLSASIR